MQTLLKALRHHAQATPFKPAILLSKHGSWTQLGYADLLEETERWALLWRQHCYVPGSVIFIILPHCIELYPAFLGAMRAGLIPSFLPYPTPKQDPVVYWHSHKALFARVNPACVLAYQDILPALGEICGSDSCALLDLATLAAEKPSGELADSPDEIDATQVALLQHSSGTTGLKKGVALTYQQIALQVSAYAGAISATPSDRIASWLPVYHDMGLIAAFLMPVSLGALVVSVDAFEWLMRPDTLLRDIERFKCTLCWLPNFAFNHLVRTRDPERAYNLSSMRSFINCSEPCKPETVRSFSETFAFHGLRAGSMHVCYGMAEMVFAVTQTRPGSSPATIEIERSLFASRSEIKIADPAVEDTLSFLSCGQVIEGAELRIVPRDGNSGRFKWARALESFGLGSTLPGKPLVGEIQVRGNFLFGGYFRNDTANESAFDGGWFRSGDMGFLHNGELYVCGRVKEMLIVHGRNYYANDIEEIVNRVSGIKPGRVVAVGFYDPNTASEEAGIIAETTLLNQADRGALGQTIREHVLSALNLSIRRIEIASEGTLIKTTSGKISREENVKRLGTGVFS